MVKFCILNKYVILISHYSSDIPEEEGCGQWNIVLCVCSKISKQEKKFKDILVMC